jgi:hypothetical protein
VFIFAALQGQTTQGLISGDVRDRLSHSPLSGVQITCTNTATQHINRSTTDQSGYYVLPLLSPGTYQLVAEKEGFQGGLYHLELSVSSRLAVDFDLRPKWDLWGGESQRYEYTSGNRIVNFYATDAAVLRESRLRLFDPSVTALHSSVSYVIDRDLIENLPLAGRDVYSVLALEAGVTSDAPTGRGLGLSVNGQRPTASNFLLDGMEENNYLLSGPLAIIPPEAVEEYRFSTNNFSAEYGRTAGFVANAISPGGGASWHGRAYSYLNNQHLNANDFQRNLHQQSRTPVHDADAGLTIGGPVATQLFASLAVDHLRFRSNLETQTVTLPTLGFIARVPAGTQAARLFAAFPARAIQAPGDVASIDIDPPSSLDRSSVLSKVERLWGGGARVMGRILVVRSARPDFVWSPYQGFSSPLDQNATSGALTAAVPIGRIESEFRLGLSLDDLRFERSNPQVPGLETAGVTLPGSPLLFSYRNRSRNWEGIANFTWTTPRHVAKAGGGILTRTLDGYLAPYRDGLYDFANLNDYASDRPSDLVVAVAQANPRAVLPDFSRQYRYIQFQVFAQDSYRLTARLSLDYGIRYESFGAPHNTGLAKDALVEDGTLRTPVGGSQALYPADRNDFAARVGFVYSLDQQAHTLLRGAYGVFYDRPFDNLWQSIRNNAVQTVSVPSPSSYPAPVQNELDKLGIKPDGALPVYRVVTAYQGDIRSPYVHSFFLRLERMVGESLSLELSTLGSFGRKLIATDVLNRQSATYHDLPEIHYRSNQGDSNYTALTAVAGYRGHRAHLQLAYTWSHTIDNQSDPLVGEFSDLFFTGVTPPNSSPLRAAFSLEGGARADRANSDFDQRQNLVLLSAWNAPSPASSAIWSRLIRHWTLSGVAALRTGFPFTIFSQPFNAPFAREVINNRVNLMMSGTNYALRQPVDGGVKLLNETLFQNPARGQLGNSGRNAFRGPGFYNIDLSVSRSFWLAREERLKATLRADFFNVLNHANLGNPDPQINSPTFGIAQYGRSGLATGFPSLVPFTESARRVQLLFRLTF